MVGVPSVITGSFELIDVSVTYGTETAVAGVSMAIPSQAVTALIGPSGCGKSTLLRCLNRMNDELGNVKVGGKILLDGVDVNDKAVDPVELRMRVGQVFQKPNPFPMSIYDNVCYGPRTHGIRKRSELDAWSRSRSSVRPCGKRSRTLSRSTRSNSPADSSSACASPARLRPIPRCC